MHSRIAAASLLVAGVSLAVGSPTPAASAADPAPGAAGLLVVEVADADAAAAAATRLGATDGGRIAPGFHLLRLPPASRATAATAAEVPGVVRAYAPTRVRASATPNDPLAPSQQHHDIVRARAAWNASTGSTAVRVAILDTGIPPHADLPSPLPQDRFDRVSQPTSCPEDVRLNEMAHGTHVAGVALSTGGNSTGTTGITWTSTLLHARVLDDCGSGTTADIAAALMWAADRGAHVINMSFGTDALPNGGDPDPALHAAVRYAKDRGAVLVAAAGNAAPQDVDFPQYPGAYPEVVGVANTGDDDSTHVGTVRGPWVDMAAPGVSILSTLPDGMPAQAYTARTIRDGQPREGWGRFTGTSMASPMVAGAAALLKAADPGLSGGEIHARLVRSARPVHRSGDAGTCVDFNAGRLDVESARTDEVNAFGYRMVSPGGEVQAFGDECYLGDASVLNLSGGIIGMATTPSRAGYWLVGTDGGIFSYGDAGFFGSTGAQRLNAPVIGMASTPTGRGYWLVAQDGGIFTYGDASFFGSTGDRRINSPVIGMAATPSGRGYWLVAGDGGIFAFGDAAFYGSTGDRRLVRPVLSMQSTPTGRGYWMVAADGGIFAFGDAAFYGSTGAMRLNRPIVGMVAGPKAGGYWLVGEDGGIFSFGNVPFFGSGAGSGLRVVATSG